MANQLDDFEAILSRQESRIRAAFIDFVRRSKDPEVIAAIYKLLEAGEINAALAIVDSHMKAVSIAYAESFADSGRAAMIGFAADLADATVGVFFDPSHPQAAAAIQRQSMNMIRQFSSEQRQAVRQAMARAYLDGTGTAGTARAFRDAIGLTSGQEAAVANYKRLLTIQSRQALDRALRDRRYDRTVARAIRTRDPLTTEQIDAMTARYRARYLAHRADMIARTQGLQATSEAREIAFRQMAEQTGVTQDRIEREWFATKDKRTRDWHATMHGQIRRLDQPFADGKGQLLMYPGDPAAPADTIISCRCAVVYQITPLR